MMTYHKIAKMCHDVNRAYCQALGDNSHKSWEETPDEIKASAIEGVKKAMENPNLTPEELHASWCQFKLDHGWGWGPEKNGDLKTHPCLVPYNELPAEQRVKDALFKSVVDANR